MKNFFLFVALSLIVLPCSAEQLLISRPRTIQEVDRNKFHAYKERLKQRKLDALEVRRAYNSGKVHKYWTAVVYPTYNPYYYQYSPGYFVERSEYKYDYQYSYGY